MDREENIGINDNHWIQCEMTERVKKMHRRMKYSKYPMSLSVFIFTLFYGFYRGSLILGLGLGIVMGGFMALVDFNINRQARRQTCVRYLELSNGLKSLNMLRRTVFIPWENIVDLKRYKDGTYFFVIRKNRNRLVSSLFEEYLAIGINPTDTLLKRFELK